jgi:hypothetical protein
VAIIGSTTPVSPEESQPISEQKLLSRPASDPSAQKRRRFSINHRRKIAESVKKWQARRRSLNLDALDNQEKAMSPGVMGAL